MNHFSIFVHRWQAAITPHTKVLILNSPHNPTGKIFSREEMKGISDICMRHKGLTIISDEVYEHIIFEGSIWCCKKCFVIHN